MKIVADELSTAKLFYTSLRRWAALWKRLWKEMLKNLLLFNAGLIQMVFAVLLLHMISCWVAKADRFFSVLIFRRNPAYAVAIGRMGKKVAEALQQRGVLGRFAVDFISVQEKDEWQHYAIEINLRKGGTTHPLLMLQFLNRWRL